MEFKNTKSIFQQIGDTICEKILNEVYHPGDRLPSVREMGADIGVNPNTVMRTYTELQNDNIISNKRGIGFFINDDAVKIILNNRKKEFFEQELPEFIKKVDLLNLSKEEMEPIIINLQKCIKQ
ncbi:GntR family transcriptional regulator [Saccharicrinis sp. FJH2]|uniref:GntR family transcriptional regulator n=1 Tax=unclassified Saccharicrinis TaxID=2646859 RepID=UPI0035D46035